MTQLSKYNDYTLCETGELPGGGGICRMFNFAAGTVTTVFQRKEEKEQHQKSWMTSGNGVAVSDAVSVALTSQMHVEKFSELDSVAEVMMMYKELVSLGGKPPALEDVLPRNIALDKETRVGKPLQMKA